MKHSTKKFWMEVLLFVITVFFAAGCVEETPTPTPTPPPPSGFHWINPSDTYLSGHDIGITAHLGTDYGGDNSCRPGHNGIDIKMTDGTPVYAVEAGTVTVFYNDPSAGNYISINHGRDPYGSQWESVYLHLGTINVTSGQSVSQGVQIAGSGHSGASSAQHLHFKLKRNGTPSDPLFYIPGGYSDETDETGERNCGSSSDDVSSGNQGGMESSPLWMWKLYTSFSSHPSLANLQAYLAPGAAGTPEPSSSNPHRKLQAAIPGTIPMADLLPPAEVLPGGIRTLGLPQDVLGNSNALETLSADYAIPLGDGSSVQGAITMFKTLNEVYAHDYAVCSRFKDGQLLYAAPIQDPAPVGGDVPVYFWGMRMSKNEIYEENATTFAVHVSPDEQDFRVDSRWMNEEYPPSSEGYFLTFQIWAADPTITAELTRGVLSQFASRGSLSYDNTVQPTAPQVIITEAIYDGDAMNLNVYNFSPSEKTVSYTAVTWAAPYPEAGRVDVFSRQVPSGSSIVQLPLPGRLDGIVYSADGGFVDKVYVSDGNWTVYDDASNGGSSHVTLTSQNCTLSSETPVSDRTLAGCGEMSGMIGRGGWGGMIRAVNVPNRPFIDISQHAALSFYARGDGQSYRVSLDTASLRQAGSWDFHQFVFTSTPEWKQYIIPLTAFTQRGWNPDEVQSFTGQDVVAVTWSAVSDSLASIDLAVDRVAFIDTPIINAVTLLPNTTNIHGPYPVNVQAASGGDTPSASLFYSLDGGASYARLPMAPSADGYSASIPGQAFGMEVRYYVVVMDGYGNTARDPVDAPLNSHRFEVSQHPALLLDDFSDTNPANALGGSSGIYAADAGGLMLVSYGPGKLKLNYDVSGVDQVTGYYTLFMHTDLSAYDVLTFQIRGLLGGEKIKVGLRDADMNESKILVSEYLSAGITTDWQEITIPLVAFSRVQKWSDMDNLNIEVQHRIGSGIGEIDVKDIQFEHVPLATVVLDNFNDSSGEDGVGASLYAYSGGGASITTEYDRSDPFGGQGASYKISYTGVTPTGWSVAGWALDGINLKASRYLRFAIRGAAGGEEPNLYLVDTNGSREFVDLEQYVQLTTDWQVVRIPLTDFSDQGIDLGHLANLEIAFEWSDTQGMIYLDNLISSSEDTSFVPMLFKAAYGGSYNAALYLQNLSAEQEAHVVIRFYDGSGGLTCTQEGSLSALASQGYWLPSIDCLGSSWAGGAVIESDQPLAVVGRPQIGAQITSYNGDVIP